MDFVSDTEEELNSLLDQKRIRMSLSKKYTSFDGSMEESASKTSTQVKIHTSIMNICDKHCSLSIHITCRVLMALCKCVQ